MLLNGRIPRAHHIDARAAPTNGDRPHATILYHYFHPDDVVSARHLSDLAAGLVARGWRVTARPSNRSCRNLGQSFPNRDSWAGVTIRRVWRPFFRPADAGRMANAAWMLAVWGLRAIREPWRHGAMIIGTDPVLSVLVARIWKRVRPHDVIAHWCFDLYPEAPIAAEMMREDSRSVRVLKRLLQDAYRSCDLIADLGSCMAERLKAYGSSARTATLPPWALVEPDSPVAVNPATRHELFGATQLGLLYSGNFGRAHAYNDLLELARRLRSEPIRFCFAARGNCVDELRRAAGPHSDNVNFAGFAPESELENRLGACDVHLVSLRPEWTGTVVPSKFFGALAAGRSVLFSGSPDSAIARWIEEHQVGWVLTPETLPAVAAHLRQLAAEPARLQEMNEHCLAVYRRHFARDKIIDRWDAELRDLMNRRTASAGLAPAVRGAVAR